MLARHLAMHRSGYAAYRLEDALGATAQRLGLQAQFFSSPTSILVAIGDEENQHTHLLRVQPGDEDPSRLAQLDREVVSGIETAFTMILVATGLVAGIVIANEIVPRRKIA